MSLKNQNSKAKPALLFLIFFISCGAKLNMEMIRQYPELISGIYYPEFGDRVRNAANLSGLDVEERNGKFTSQIFSFKNSVTFSGVEKFYDDELHSLGFQKENIEPIKSASSKILYYKKDGFLVNQKIAVVFIEIEDYETKKIYPFLTICISE